MNNNKLTKKDFWSKNTENWKQDGLPIKLDADLRAERAFMSIFDNYFKKTKQEENCIEIGCNPGKFLIYFHEKLGYKISGIDYDESGIDLTNQNLDSAEIDGEIIQADIFDCKIDEKFDVVMSMGFMEHFTGLDLEKALEFHVDLLKENGTLFISIPNFRYINYLFAYFFRNNMIAKHNLEIMDRDFFTDISKKYELEIKYFSYFGGIHPGGLKLGNENSSLRNQFVRLIRMYEKLKFLDNINSKYFSHHLGAVFVKKKV